MGDPIKTAYEFAREAHKGQVDRGGITYIEHPLKVASMVKTTNQKTTALLHDVIEDCGVTIRDLKEMGFNGEVTKAVDALSRVKGEPDESYLGRVVTNKIAIAVKIADLTHNSDLSRIPKVSEEDIQRRDKYQDQIKMLKASNKG